MEALAVSRDFRPPPNALADRIVLITGAAGGIGAALATACASLGATVVLSGRKLRPLEVIYDRIEGQGGPQPALYPIDLEGATPDDYAKLNATLIEQFGRLDALVHLAAKLEGLTPLAHIRPLRWMATMQVNLNAPALMTQACLDALGRAESPRVVYAADEADRRDKAYWGAYGVAKAGLESLAKIQAAEGESAGLRVALVWPGAVRTRLMTHSYPGLNPQAWPEPAQALGPFLRALVDDRAVDGAPACYRWR